MDKIYLGKVITTHGIKGEIRILSNFKYKDKAFKVGNKIIINNDILNIKTYRVHKGYDMITFTEYNNINEVLKYIKEKVYIDRSFISDIDYLDEDLIGMDVIFNSKIVGKIKNIENSNKISLIIIDSNDGIKYVPNNKEFIDNIDFKDNKVYIKYVEGLL